MLTLFLFDKLLIGNVMFSYVKSLIAYSSFIYTGSSEPSSAAQTPPCVSGSRLLTAHLQHEQGPNNAAHLGPELAPSHGLLCTLQLTVHFHTSSLTHNSQGHSLRTEVKESLGRAMFGTSCAHAGSFEGAF